MYYTLHFLLAVLYLIPSLFTDVYTEIMVGYTYELITTIVFSSVGIIYGILHFLINYFYMKKGKINTKLALYYPVAVMAVFIIVFYINATSTDWDTINANHPGFYILMISLIFWSLIGYIICNSIYQKHLIDLTKKYDLKEILLKKLPLKILIFLIILFIVSWSTELCKNEIFTIKYGEPFKNADSYINMLGDEEYFKVIDYSDVQAEIYYVSKGMTCGSKVRYRNIDNQWTFTGYSTVWSTTGSASETIWPYWWHFIYGGF